MAEKIIQSLSISTEDIPAAGASRYFTIRGEEGAGCLIQVVNSDGNFYNFSTQVFSGGVGGSMSTFAIDNVLRVNLWGSVFSGTIYFPATAAMTYSVILMPDPTSYTRLAGRKQVINKSISQFANSTVTFAVATTTSNYSSSPAAANITTVGSSALTSATDVNADYTVTNVSSDGYGFGLRLIRQPLDGDWYFTTTDTVNGTISSATDVVIDDLTDIIVGMLITGVSSGSLSGTPTITSIDTATKTLTLSVAQSFADGITLTFQARGMSDISKVLGCDVGIGSLSAIIGTTNVTTTVRGVVSNSTTITVNGTYGISGGSFVRFDGVNVDNTSTNDVNVVTASSSAGQFTCDVNQTFKGNEVLTFNGSSSTIDIAAGLIISRYPTANRTIYLNLDNFITPGVSGA
jgi:hypothetical protein